MTEQQKKIKAWLDRLPIRVNNETSDVKAMPKELWCLYKLAPIYELGECCGHSFLLDMRDIGCIENLKEYSSAKEFMISNDINTVIPQMADNGLRVCARYEGMM